MGLKEHENSAGKLWTGRLKLEALVLAATQAYVIPIRNVVLIGANRASAGVCTGINL